MNRDLYNRLIENKVLPVIAGPTAGGKTAVSIELSKLIDVEVISADSRQIFKYLNIGTATPSKDELNAVKTHFINIIRPDEYYSAGLFAKQAEKVVNKIYSRNKIPIIVGGSGLYIKALCEGIFEENNLNLDNNDFIEKYKELEQIDINELYNELMKIDKKSAILYQDLNPRRIIRALAYYNLTGIPFSTAHDKFDKKSDFKPIYFGIDFPRDILYERINQRTEIIWKNGLIRETRNVLSRGFSEDLNSLNTVGYKEAIQFLKENISEVTALDMMKQNTRRYAKRQITWFKKVPNIIWLNGSERQIAYEIENKLKKYSLSL